MGTPISIINRFLGLIPKSIQHAFVYTNNNAFANSFSSVYYDEALIEALGTDKSPERRMEKDIIADHIFAIYTDVMAINPSLIVELGTRGGHSTRALLAAANRCNSEMISVDVDDCSNIDLPEPLRSRWTFIHSDDLEFGESFPSWCQEQNTQPKIDVLFIDSSHHYEHTLQELNIWLDYVDEGGIVLLHDTHLHKSIRRPNNEVTKIGWDNDRGVIKALEEYFGREYDEKKYFVDINKGWLIRHHPYSAGLTLLKRL